jgi:hypothetical protein
LIRGICILEAEEVDSLSQPLAKEIADNSIKDCIKALL